MTKDIAASRRAFLKGSAVVAAPLAAVVPGVAVADDGARERLARLEDERAIEALQRQLIKALNGSGDCGDLRLSADMVQVDAGLRAIAPDLAADDAVELAADGQTATARLSCRVELDCEFTGETTLERMARFQGHGSHRHAETRVLTTRFAKYGDGWQISGTRLA